MLATVYAAVLVCAMYTGIAFLLVMYVAGQVYGWELQGIPFATASISIVSYMQPFRTGNWKKLFLNR
jgi:hypothetical protein